MGRSDKILRKILSGTADANIEFSDLIYLLECLGFEKRIRGSHHIFRKENIPEKPNLQKDGSKAKKYQVKQVRDLILKYHMGGSLHE